MPFHSFAVRFVYTKYRVSKPIHDQSKHSRLDRSSCMVTFVRIFFLLQCAGLKFLFRVKIFESEIHFTRISSIRKRGKTCSREIHLNIFPAKFRSLRKCINFSACVHVIIVVL